jgi:hypothetical protein
MKKLLTLITPVLVIFGSISGLAQDEACNSTCLAGIARQYMAEVYRDNPSIQAARATANDVVIREFSSLPWGDRVRFTENNVAMMIGEGFWGAARGDYTELLVLADENTGNVVWFGITEEHEQAAYHAMRLKIEGSKITEVETYLGREGTPDFFAPTTDYAVNSIFSETVPRNQRSNRQGMMELVNSYLETKQENDGSLLVEFADNCARVSNGVDVTFGDYWAADIAQGCAAQLKEGIYKPVNRIRARRFPVINEEKGVVVALSIEDHATRYVNYESNSGQSLKVDIEYPNSRGLLEIFKIVDGEIARIEGISVFLPYYIQDLWK